MSKRAPTFEFRVPVICCPLCGGDKIRPTGSRANGDGSRTKHYRCLGCNRPFRLVVEYTAAHFHLMDEPGSGPRRIPA